MAGIRGATEQRWLERKHERVSGYLVPAAGAVQEAFARLDERASVVRINRVARQGLADAVLGPIHRQDARPDLRRRAGCLSRSKPGPRAISAEPLDAREMWARWPGRRAARALTPDALGAARGLARHPAQPAA